MNEKKALENRQQPKLRVAEVSNSALCPEVGKKYHVLNMLKEPVEVVIERNDLKRKESLVQSELQRGFIKWSRILPIF